MVYGSSKTSSVGVTVDSSVELTNVLVSELTYFRTTATWTILLLSFGRRRVSFN